MFNPDSLKGWWDALTAVGTVSMAVATFIVIRQGRRLRKDAARPICVLTPYDGVDPRHWRDTLLTVRTDPPRPGFGIIEIKCILRNIGPGPALNVSLMFRFHDMAGYTTQPWELGPLGTGESRGSESEPLRIPIQFEPRFNDADFDQVPGKAWELILVYENIFGNSFHSMHPKHPLQMNRLHRLPGDEKSTAPMQPWVTLGTGKPPAYSGERLLVGFVGETKPAARQICTRVLQQIWGFLSRP